MKVEPVKGYFTVDAWLRGYTATQIADLLGFGQHLVSSGLEVYALIRLPEVNEFTNAGYTHLADGVSADVLAAIRGRTLPGALRRREIEAARQNAFASPAHIAIDRRFMPGPEERAKRNVREVWIAEKQTLVKVKPLGLPSGKDHIDYPPGRGVPQWILTTPIDARFVAYVRPSETYRG